MLQLNKIDTPRALVEKHEWNFCPGQQVSIFFAVDMCFLKKDDFRIQYFKWKKTFFLFSGAITRLLIIKRNNKKQIPSAAVWTLKKSQICKGNSAKKITGSSTTFFFPFPSTPAKLAAENKSSKLLRKNIPPPNFLEEKHRKKLTLLRHYTNKMTAPQASQHYNVSYYDYTFIKQTNIRKNS